MASWAVVRGMEHRWRVFWMGARGGDYLDVSAESRQEAEAKALRSMESWTGEYRLDPLKPPELLV